MPRHITIENDEIVQEMIGLSPGSAAASSDALLNLQILPQATKAYYTNGNVLTNYATDASGINLTNLKALWGGRACASIGSSAFFYCTALVSADFPLVTSIGSGAFQSCDSLTSADFPLATSIGSGAFNYCSALASIDSPLVTTIGIYAFYGCSALASADFPLVTSIGSYAFFNCSSLTSAAFPLATTIGSYAFFNCTVLTALYLNAPLSGLGANALASSSVTTIHLRPAPNTPAGWTEGTGQTIKGKTGVTVVLDWTTYPNQP